PLSASFCRSVLLRRIGLAGGQLRDPIPWPRWFLSPWRTWLLWRRMLLWQITDYPAAVEAELAVRHAMNPSMRPILRRAGLVGTEAQWQRGACRETDEHLRRLGWTVM